MSERRIEHLLSKCAYSFTSGEIQTSSAGPTVVSTKYGLPDTADYSKRAFLRSAVVHGGKVVSTSTAPLDERVRGSVLSPSGSLELRVTEGGSGSQGSDKAAVFLEIWRGDEQMTRTLIPGCKDVYFQGSLFGGPQFFNDEAAVVLVAEKADAKYPRGFWAENKEGTDPAEKFRLRPDYGETATKTREPTLITYSIATQGFKTVPIPGHHPGFPTVIPHAPNSILAVGYRQSGQLHIPGLSRCFNRASSLFRLDNVFSDSPAVRCVTEGLFTALAPAVSSDGTLTVFPGHKDRFSAHCTELDLFALTDAGVEKIEVPKTRSDAAVIPTYNGLCLSSQAESSLLAFLPDSHRLVVPAFSSGKSAIFIVDVPARAVTASVYPPVSKQEPGSVVLIKQRGNELLFTHQGYTATRSLWLARVAAGTDVEYTQIFASPALDSALTSHFLGAQLSVIQTPTCSGWLLRSAAAGPKPLIAYLHGGPHMMAVTSFSVEIANFLSAGYDVVIPNYRGSLSFGKPFLDALVGQAGIVDVADCHACVQAAQEMLSPTTVVAYGGSHGGFLTAWLLGNKETNETYSAGVLWNPAVDLISSCLTSDIPDWALSQVLSNDRCLTEPVFAPTAEFFEKAYQQSPMAVVENVRVPALVVLGSADKRVVPCGGLRWAQAVEANDGHVDVFWYPEQGHAIPGPESYETAIVTIATWIDRHIAKERSL